MSPGQLVADYEANEVAADNRYKGKTLRVTGAVQDIRKDLTDSIFVTLRSGHPIREVQVFFDDSLTSEIANLRKGDQVTVQAECRGLLLNVLLHDAVFVIDPAAIAERAWALYNAEDHGGAIKVFSEAIAADRNHLDSYLGRGNAKLLTGDLAGAIADYDVVVAARPKDVDTRTNRGLAKQETGDASGALADFDVVVTEKPNDPMALVNRASARTDTGNARGAMEDCTKVLTAERNDLGALFERGRARSALGESAAAVQDLSAAIQLAPDHARAFSERAKVKDKLGDKRGAALDWEVAVSLNPKLDAIEQARAYARANVWPEALSQAPQPESPDEAQRRARIENSVRRWVGPLISGLGVQVIGNRAHVTVRGKFHHEPGAQVTRPAQGITNTPLAISIAKDTSDAIQEIVPGVVAVVTVLDLTGAVAKVDKSP